MAPMNKKSAVEASLPRLLALDKRHHEFDDSIKDAASIAGIRIEAVNEGVDATLRGHRPSQTRSEFTLRWTLEKLKTAEGRKVCRESKLVWPFLRQLVSVLPPSSVARYLQSSSFMRNMGSLLAESARECSAPGPENHAAAAEIKRNSKKRKRDTKAVVLSLVRDGTIRAEDPTAAVLGILSVLQSIISLTTSASAVKDLAAREQLSAAIRTSAEDASQILNAWLQCLEHLSSQAPIDEVVQHAHQVVLHVWSCRTLEQNDETGASPKPFSTNCLVPLLKLLHMVSSEIIDNPHKTALHKSLDQLLAKHLLVPARSSFDAAQASKTPNLQRSRSALHAFLEPVRSAVAEINGIDHPAAALLKALPAVLDLAIRLSPSSTPLQETAQLPWLESVFAALSACAQEPIPFDDAIPALPLVALSPITPMLCVLKQRNVKPSSDFLELLLVGYSGLKSLRKLLQPVRLSMVAAVFELNGGVFLKDSRSTEANLPVAQIGQSPYVEALVGSLSEIEWDKPGAVPTNEHGSGDNATCTFAVRRLLIPLLQAYSSARKIPSFISLWFWEARRQWKRVGGSEEQNWPWFSSELSRAFQDQFESSLSAARVGELLVEFILPVRQFVDEITRSAPQASDWQARPSAAPACAALTILDVLLQSIRREETMHQNPAAWNALKDLPSKLAMLDLVKFPAASRIWGIMTSVYKLSLGVDSKDFFVAQQKSLLEGNELFLQALKKSTHNKAFDPASLHLLQELLAPNRFIVTVCGLELDASLQGKATEALQTIITGLLKSFEGAPTDSRLLFSLSHVIALFIQYSSIIILIEKDRTILFKTILKIASQSDQTMNRQLLDAFVATLLEGDSRCLRDFMTLLDDIVTSNSHVEYESRVVDCLARIPANLIPRAQREHILDHIACLEPYRMTSNFSETAMSSLIRGCALLIRLLSCPSPTAELCIEPAKALELGYRLDSFIEKCSALQSRKIYVLQLLDRLFTNLMNQALGGATVERQQHYFNTFITLVQAHISPLVLKDKPRKSITMEPVLVLILKCFLVATNSAELHQETCAQLQNQLCLTLEKLQDNQATDSIWAWVQRRTISDLCRLTKNNAHAKTLELARPLLEDQQTDDMSAITIVEIGGLLDPNVSAKSYLARLDSHLYGQTYCTILDIFERQVETMRIHHKLEMASELLRHQSDDRLQLLHIIIKHISPDESTELESPKLLLVRLCQILNQASNSKEFGSATAAVTTILRSKSHLVTQDGIDRLLKTLTTLSSAQAPGLFPRDASFIFGRICQLTTSTILLHRRRLGGRMHLLVALLQNLLSCLFTPHRYQTAVQLSRPPWLLADKGLDVADAISFTRVLTTLCSPTVSSTVSHRGFRMADASLVDETKKAKAYAGQYVSYLLLHYCTLQLQGSVSSEVAEKLKMGLWAIMEIVDIEAMRGMNAGMDREERVVWGALFAEWNRLGRFKLT